MPSEQLPVPDQPQDIPSVPQVKICSSCHSALPFILSPAEPLVCALCRECPADPPAHRQFRIDQDAPYAHRPSLALDVPSLLSSRWPQQDSAAYDNVLASTSSDIYHPSPIPPASYPKKPVLSNIQCNISPVSAAHRQPAHFSAVPYETTSTRHHQQQQQQHSIATADPLADITRLRIRSRPHHCLYPGATFQGTQKSGRNSYDVNVTIVVGCLCYMLFLFKGH